MRGLTAFQRDILHILAGLGECHGKTVKEEIEDYYGEEVYSGRLYPNLDELVECGLVDKTESVPTEGECNYRGNAYSVTEDGFSVLDRRNQWEQQYYKTSKSTGSVPARPGGTQSQ